VSPNAASVFISLQQEEQDRRRQGRGVSVMTHQRRVILIEYGLTSH